MSYLKHDGFYNHSYLQPLGIGWKIEMHLYMYMMMTVKNLLLCIFYNCTCTCVVDGRGGTV